jgi:cytochrome bd ubiquinol oxidase subunit II
MIEIVVFFFVVSIFLYAFLAGADFGAGILELLPIGIKRKEKVELIGKAMGPVWEANHIWLILALVIAFNGFPRIFWFMSEFYHFPLGLLVIGIIFRGASFTFLHYDPIKDKSQKTYHWIFGLSSAWCCFWLGVIVGSLMLGEFNLTDNDPFNRYFNHWLNLYSFSTGIFVTTLMMFNASLFLYVESPTDKQQWRKITLIMFLTLILTGFINHLIFFIQNKERWIFFFLYPINLTLIAASAVLLLPQLTVIKRGFRNTSRILASLQLSLIMAAGFLPLFPKVIFPQQGEAIDLYTSAAEPGVMRALVQALVVGSFLIFPAYFYLMRIFKKAE